MYCAKNGNLADLFKTSDKVVLCAISCSWPT